MAAKRFKIAGSIRHKGKRFAPGQERELAGVLNAEERTDFIDRGLLVEVEPEGYALVDDSAEVDALRIEISDLKLVLATEIEARKRASTQVEELSAKLGEASTNTNTLITENDRLKHNLELASGEMKRTESERDGLKNEVATLRDKLTESKSETKTVTKERDDLKKDVTGLQGKLTKAEADLAKAKAPAAS